MTNNEIKNLELAGLPVEKMAELKRLFFAVVENERKNIFCLETKIKKNELARELKGYEKTTFGLIDAIQAEWLKEIGKVI